MKGHFKKGALPEGLQNQGFKEDETYECFYNSQHNLVVESPLGFVKEIQKGFVEDIFNVTTTTTFKITSRF